MKIPSHYRGRWFTKQLVALMHLWGWMEPVTIGELVINTYQSHLN